MRRITVCILGTVVLLHTAAAQIQDPFSVTVESEATGADRSLSVRLIVPANHYIYADQVAVKADAGDVLVARQSPTPKEQYDDLLEKVVSIFDRDAEFLYAVKTGTQLPFSVTVSYQGCSVSPMLCFLPSERTFTAPDPSKEAESRPPSCPEGRKRSNSSTREPNALCRFPKDGKKYHPIMVPAKSSTRHLQSTRP